MNVVPMGIANDKNAAPKVAEAPPTEIFAPIPDGLVAALPLLIRLQKRPRACSAAVLWQKLIPLLDPERIYGECKHRLQFKRHHAVFYVGQQPIETDPRPLPRRASTLRVMSASKRDSWPLRCAGSLIQVNHALGGIDLDQGAATRVTPKVHHHW